MKAERYYKKLGKKIITAKKIQNKIKKMAKQISADYKNDEVVLICNLKGSFRFLADLISYMTIPTKIDFIAFKSYEGTMSSEKIRIVKDLKIDISNKRVLIVEDIIDTGLTLDYIVKYLEEFKSPKEIKIAVLLDKPSKRKIDIKLDYKGFEIPDVFVVGYGLDYNEYFRELNDIVCFNE